MWEILAYALIAAGSVLSTFVTNKQNKQESDKQRQWQENMMDKQNEYNRMQNQFARSEEAGVNPLAVAMAEGGVSVSGNTSAVPGNYQLPNIMDPMSLLGNSASNLASAFGNAQSGITDKTLRGARLQEIQHRCAEMKEHALNLHASTEGQLIANKYADQREIWALKGKKADVSLSYAQVASTNEVARKTAQEIKNLITQQLKTESDIELNYLNMEDVLAHIASQYKDIELKDSQIGLNVAKTAETEQNTDLLSAETDLKKQESSKYGELTDRVLRQYDEGIKEIQARTGKTNEEAYWIMFDKADQYTPKFMGLSIDLVGSSKRVKQVRNHWRAKVGRNASTW